MRGGPALAVAGCMLAGAAAAEWKLEHEEDFTRARDYDRRFWQAEEGFIRNRESQYYTPANIRVADGALVIEARRERVPNAAHRPGSRSWIAERAFAEYTSGSLVSRGAMLYGRIEVVARTPAGAGVWPAIWLLHESEGLYGEIDIYEFVGKHPDTAFAAVHYGSTPASREHRNANRIVPGLGSTWRRHTVEWTADRIVISLDGQPLFTFDPRTARTPRGEPLRRPMRLRMNLALGGSWGGEIDDRKLPARFEIQSVRIWGWAPGQVAPLAAVGAAQAPEPMPAAAPVAQESPPTRSAPDTPAATVPAAAPGLPAAPVESGGRGAPRWGR